ASLIDGSRRESGAARADGEPRGCFLLGLDTDQTGDDGSRRVEGRPGEALGAEAEVAELRKGELHLAIMRGLRLSANCGGYRVHGPTRPAILGARREKRKGYGEISDSLLARYSSAGARRRKA